MSPARTHDPISGHIGYQLAQARKDRGLRQEDVAQKMGVTACAISYFERGLNHLRVWQLIELCRILDQDPVELLRTTMQDKVHLIERYPR